MSWWNQSGDGASWWTGSRRWLNDNSSIVVVIIVLVLGVSLLIAKQPKLGTHTQTPEQWAYYYDVERESYFVGEAAQTPPIESPWGNPSVRARFFSCGDCDRDGKFIGYYETYEAEAAETLRNTDATYEVFTDEHARNEYYRAALGGALMSADGREWVSDRSQKAAAIRRAAAGRCAPGQKLTPCFPK